MLKYLKVFGTILKACWCQTKLFYARWVCYNGPPCSHVHLHFWFSQHFPHWQVIHEVSISNDLDRTTNLKIHNPIYQRHSSRAHVPLWTLHTNSKWSLMHWISELYSKVKDVPDLCHRNEVICIRLQHDCLVYMWVIARLHFMMSCACVPCLL